MATEFPPVAICPFWRSISYEEKRIGQRCGRKPGGVRCMGVYLNALNKRGAIRRTSNFCPSLMTLQSSPWPKRAVC